MPRTTIVPFWLTRGLAARTGKSWPLRMSAPPIRTAPGLALARILHQKGTSQAGQSRVRSSPPLQPFQEVNRFSRHATHSRQVRRNIRLQRGSSIAY